MKTRNITAYFCNHCNKLYQKKHFCEKHEQRCFNNPNNFRPCFSCKHLEFIETSVHEETPWHEYEKKVKAFYCAKKKHHLIPPIVRHKHGNYVFEFEDIENIDMPKKCDQKECFNKLPFE